ncbi:MAG TPA: ACP S-malonyltransferase [Chlamydiales bacterium]|nr:ACP S-malonyltransferase [Chlamydiales bacterium]
MRKQAFLFPGQGAQYVGMGKDFFDSFGVAKETFQEADDILNETLSKIIFEGPENILTQTKYCQAAIFVNSIAILRVLRQQMPNFVPFVTAGLSLGEYGALHASEKLSFKDTLILLQKRALFMNEACEKVPGTMAAILGLTAEQVETALKGVPGLWVANFNCPGQIVISGTKEGVEQGSQILKEQGAKRVIPLSVAGAFHSGLMQRAQDMLAPLIMAAPIEESSIQFVMNAVGGFVSTVSDIRKYLISQVTSSVRWEQGIRAMNEKSVDRYVEIGCGTTLSGMNRKIGVTGEILSVEKVSDLDKIGSM